MYLVDTSIWVEYFRGSSIGAKFHNMLKTGDFFTTDSVMSEIFTWCSKEKYDFKRYAEIVCSNSEILSINYVDWINAAKIKFEQRKNNRKFGIMDALLIAKQENKFLLTKDRDFKGLPKVKILS